MPVDAKPSTHRRRRPVGPCMPSNGVGWQPSRFLADRAEAERAFALAERLGSVNAAAAELGTTWPSLRKAFQRHGLGMPARNPEAVRQRAIEAAHQRSGRPATPSVDPVFVALNHSELPVRPGRVGSWPSGSAAPRTTRCWAPGWWWSYTPKATPPSLAPVPGRSPAARSAPTAARPTAPAAPTGPTDPRREGWLPVPADPSGPEAPSAPATLRSSSLSGTFAGCVQAAGARDASSSGSWS
jgi:hypothetical protein